MTESPYDRKWKSYHAKKKTPYDYYPTPHSWKEGDWPSFVAKKKKSKLDRLQHIRLNQGGLPLNWLKTFGYSYNGLKNFLTFLNLPIPKERNKHPKLKWPEGDSPYDQPPKTTSYNDYNPWAKKSPWRKDAETFSMRDVQDVGGDWTVEFLVRRGISEKNAELVADFTVHKLRQMDSKQLNDLIEDRREDVGGLEELFGPSLSQKIQAALHDHPSNLHKHKFYPLNVNPYYVYSIIGFPLILTHKTYFCPRCKEYVELRSQSFEDKDTIYISHPKSGVEAPWFYRCSECTGSRFEKRELGSLFG